MASLLIICVHTRNHSHSWKHKLRHGNTVCLYRQPERLPLRWMMLNQRPGQLENINANPSILLSIWGTRVFPCPMKSLIPLASSGSVKGSPPSRPLLENRQQELLRWNLNQLPKSPQLVSFSVTKQWIYFDLPAHFWAPHPLCINGWALPTYGGPFWLLLSVTFFHQTTDEGWTVDWCCTD